VTLKFRLRVTHGHWKRNHWTDHTRLTISRVIGRWILSLPWKVIESGTIWKLVYGFLFAFYRVTVAVFVAVMRYSVSKNGMTLKTRLGVVQGH